MKNNIYILTMAALALTLTSCKKFLEKSPDMRIQLNSKEKLAQLLTSAYPKSEYISFTEISSDNAQDKGVRADYFYGILGNTGPAWDRSYFWQDVENGGLIQGSTDNYWNAAYLAIASANTALEYIGGHPDDVDLIPYKGEALVARAYAHFMLVSLYSPVYKPGNANDGPGVPYMTAPEVTISPQYTRGTVASVYANIERDLTEGISLINNSVFKIAAKYHFTTSACHAFAARFYLFKGEYEKVIEHGNRVLVNSQQAKSVLRPWNSVYSNLVSDEFSSVFTQSTQNATLLMAEASSFWFRNYSNRYGFGATVEMATIASPNVSGGSYAYFSNKNREPYFSTHKFNELFFETRIGSGIGFPYIMVPLFTTDELIMNRAEAYASAGHFDLALQDINTFLSTRITDYHEGTHSVTLDKIAGFYGIADPKGGLIKTVLDLKRAAFVSEGLRWFDIVRHDLTVRHNHLDANGNETFTELRPGDPRRVFQLPQPVVKAGINLNPR